MRAEVRRYINTGSEKEAKEANRKVKK